MATFEINYRTNGWAAFYRFVLPWLAVMVILLLAPNLGVCGKTLQAVAVFPPEC